ADGADLSLTALDSSAPAIATSVAFDNLRVSDLPPVELGNGTRAVPSFSRVPKAIITASYAGKSLCAHAPLAVDEIRGLPVAVARLKGQAYLAGDVLQLADIRAEAAGGQVTAFAALDVRQNRLAAAAQLDSVDVAQIRPLLGDQFDHTLGGKASGVVWASGEKDKGIADCSFLVAAPQVDRYAAAQAAAAVRVGEAGIEVPWFVVEADQGRVAGRARIENGTLTARVAAADVDVGAVGVLAGAEGLEGRAWAVAEVSGPLDQPAFEVETTVIGPGIGGQRAEALYAKANGTPHQLRVSRLLAAREGTVAEASLTAVNLSSEQPYADLDGTFRILGAELPTVLSWAGLSADELEGGQVAVEGKISGTVLDPAITGTAHVAGVSWDIYRLESLTAPIQLRGATLRIGPAAGTALGVPVSGSARIDNLTDPQSLEASATFATGPIDLSRLVALHRYAVGIEGEARVRHAELFFANGHLRGASASVDCNGVTLGEQRLAPFSFVVETQDEAIYLKPATVEIAGGRCELSGRYEPASGEITAQASMADCNVDELLEAVSSVLPAGVVGEKVAKLLPSLALRMAGRVSGVLAVSGPSSAPDARVQLSAVDLSLDQRSLPRLQLACRYDASDRTISDIAAEAQYADGLITASGSAALGGRIDLLVEATNLDVARLREWLPAGHSLAGTLQFTCQVGGQTESPVVRGSFDVLDVNVEGIRFDIVSVPVFDVAEGSIAFDTLIFKRGEHEIRAHGRLPFTWQGPSVPGDRPVAVSASVSALDLETVFAILDEYRRAKGPEGPARVWSAVEAHGEVDAEAQVSGTLQKPQIGGSLRLTRAALRFPSWAKPVQDIDLVLVMEPVPEGSLITVSRASARYENSTLAVGGSVGLKRVGPSAFLDNNWNLTFTVEANGQKLPGGGTVDAAKVVATFLSTEPGKASFRFAEGFAKLGSGDVKIEGGADITQADLARLQRNSFDIKVAARRVRLVYSPYVDGLVSGAIEIANPEEGADAVVRGQLVLSQAVVAPEFTGLGTMRVVRGAPKLAPAFSLDVGVAVGDNVVFRAAGVQAVVRPAPAAHLSGTPQEPRLSGAVSLLRGQASMPGGLLEIERFDLSYSVAPQPTAYEPPKPLELRARLSGQATRVISEVMVDQRTVGPVRIYLSIDGQVPGELSVRATSEPPLAEEQIYAILGAVPLGGFTPAAGGATEVLSQRFVSLIAMGLRASILEPLEAKLREFLGLTEFTVSFQLEQPVEVRLGKYLARNLLVSYRYQLGTPGRETWLLSVSYEVLPNVVVSYRARDDGEERFSVGIRRDL
ncbi:MAG: translocation/assembly module TamB domain-containing protein, partial [Armatimonadetes bacterium]|nr:translocation/assembly module TamB domain-containing protein [Armatimonadota bacterium]